MKVLGIVLVCLISFQNQAQRSDFSSVDFRKADSIARSQAGADLHNIPRLAHDLTYALDSEVEQFRAIYMWVCTNIKNDYRMYQRNHSKRMKYMNDSLKLASWNSRFQKILFKSLLRDRRSICSGYAFLIKELCDQANLQCRIIDGFARTSTTNIDKLIVPNHQWNAVRLNGKWYLCDATWASGITNPKSYQFEFDYNDGFFLASPQLFAINHFPKDMEWFLLDTEIPSFETFLNNPVLYGKAYSYLSQHISPIQLENTIEKKTPIHFKYELLQPESVHSVQFEIDNGHSIKRVDPKVVTQNQGQLILEHQFNYNGYYDVHLFLNQDRIATYVFEVKN